MRQPYKWWIKERHTGQFAPYFVGCGRLSKKKAADMEKPLVGRNIMHSYDSEEEYSKRLEELKSEGRLV